MWRGSNIFLKCPFNYVGGKYKLLPQLYRRFPKDNDIFLDVFGGGFNVGINSNADKIVYNDQLTPLVELLRYLQKYPYDEIITYIEYTIKKYDIKKEDNVGFLKFRDKYNNDKDKFPLDLYILICYSFNYQFRFNNKGEYNNAHGTNRSSFTKNMKGRLNDYCVALKNKNIFFLNEDFMDLDYDKLTENSFAYFDPPYLITTGSYNDGNRGFKNWTVKEEIQLLNLLTNLNDEGVRFGLSNVVMHEGKRNELLLNWVRSNKNLKVINISSDYSNSNYHKKSRRGNEEVLIINF